MPKLQKLSNGLNVLTVPVKGAKTTAILIMVATGSKYESRQTSGLSHFLEHMFFKGTEKRPDTLTLTSLLDRVGGEYNAFTSKEYTGYWIKVAHQETKLALDVLSDMLLNSKFSSEEIEREKGVIIEEVNMYLDNPMMHIEDVFEEGMYGDTPAGWSTIGTKKNILGFKREDFVTYFKNQYKTSNSFICIAGVIPKDTPRLLNDFFKGWAKGSAKPKLVVKERQTAPAIRLEYKKTDQAHLALGVRTMPYGHPDELILKMIATTLGGSMSSRLFLNLRERNGLCYYVRTGSEQYSDTGYLVTQAGVPVTKIEQAIKIIVKEYKTIAEELITPAELQKVKRFITGRLTLSLEGTDDLANWYGRQLVLRAQQPNGSRKPLISPQEFLRQVNKVTSADIRRVAKKVFNPKCLNLAIIGPYQKEAQFRSLLK